MRLRTLFLFALACLLYPRGPLAAQAQTAQKPVKVFLLAGQSNMQGYGHIRTLDWLGQDPKFGHLLKQIKKPDGSFVVRDDV